jgi:formylmethanofuran dehydrogenase subunit E
MMDSVLYDLYRHERDLQKELDRLPKCDYCDEPIQDEHFFIVDGEKFCKRCMKDNFQVRTDDYTED